MSRAGRIDMEIINLANNHCARVDEPGWLLVKDIEKWIGSLSIICREGEGFVMMSDPDTGAKFMIKKIDE